MPTHHLTPESEAWIETVIADQPRIAVFDCDGTLWAPDSGYGFMRWTLAGGLILPQAAVWMEGRYREYEHGSVSEETICGEMVQVYAGLAESTLRSASARYFAEEVEPLIFTEMESLVHKLRESGTDIWAVSSTNNWVVEAGVSARFGIPPDRVLAARVRIVDGLATGELLAVPTDETKATALQAAGIARPDAVFGNSIHDLAMLEMARRPYPVNPSHALHLKAEAVGWVSYLPQTSQGSVCVV